jgi:hypothetical protein
VGRRRERRDTDDTGSDQENRDLQNQVEQRLCRRPGKSPEVLPEVLGFIKKRDIPLGGKARWLTVVSADEPNGTELLLEPTADHPATQTFKKAIYEQGMPLTMFAVDDVQKEYERLQKLGVVFRTKPTQAGTGRRSRPSTTPAESYPHFSGE